MGNNNLISKQSLKRGLKQRYVSMIALGGSIGTGLFVTSGSSISQAGPGGAIVAYIIMDIMVYFLMTSLGEMATNMPVTGSFATYAGKYVDPALGFAMGWNYWFDYAINNAVEISTAAIIMKFWLPNVPGWIWSLTILLLIVILNILAVGNFGAAEFWISAIKVVTIIVFLIVGLLVILGILGGHATGLSNFTYKKAPFVGGIPAIIGVFVVAGFSFQGTEMVGVTAGESQNPGKAIPEAIHQTFWRILLFYILSIAVIAAIIPYTSKYLLGSSITISPFTLIFKRAGLALAASVINVVILTAVISATNSGMYASTRMLYSMAHDGYAPKVFGRVMKNGIPIYALIATAVIGLLAFLTSFVGPQVYMWLVACSSLTGFIAWWGITIAHYHFRRVFIKQRHRLNELKYYAGLFPVGPLLSLILCTLVIIAQNPSAFANWDWYQIGVTYISVPLVIILYVFYKIKYHTKLIPLNQVDVKPHAKDN